MKRLNKFRINLADIRQRWSNLKLKKLNVFWIVLGAVIFTVYVGFSKGGWVTSATASQMAETTSRAAVVDRLAPICVAQANQDSLMAQKLEELKGLTTTSKRANFIKDQGWAIMPGEKASDNSVVAECARQLMLLDN
ncbi:MAG: hypothetical protein WAM60_12100 [Candidatus Promineifilaceae bacterium]